MTPTGPLTPPFLLSHYRRKRGEAWDGRFVMWLVPPELGQDQLPQEVLREEGEAGRQAESWVGDDGETGGQAGRQRALSLLLECLYVPMRGCKLASAHVFLLLAYGTLTTTNPSDDHCLPPTAYVCVVYTDAMVVPWGQDPWTGKAVVSPGVLFRQVMARSQVRRHTD